jgi:hypothetical protein
LSTCKDGAKKFAPGTARVNSISLSCNPSPTLGHRERFDAVPFSWTSQFDFSLCYAGHAEKWDKLDLDGSIEDGDCRLSFQRGGKTLAVATIGRDHESPESELAMEQSNGQQSPTHAP